MPTQFPYPEDSWAVGNMRMARAGPRGMDPGREYRELEGVRKKKEQVLSEADTGMHPDEWNKWFQGVQSGKGPGGSNDISGYLNEATQMFKGGKINKQQFLDFLDYYAPKAKPQSEWEGPGQNEPGPQRATG